MTDKMEPQILELPLLPLRDLVVFPHMVVPLIVGRPRSRTALGEADAGDRKILLVAQRNGHTSDPLESDIFDIGTVANMHQMLRLPDDNLKVLVEGTQRARIIKYIPGADHFRVQVELIDDNPADLDPNEGLVQAVKKSFEQYVKLNKGIPPEFVR